MRKRNDIVAGFCWSILQGCRGNCGVQDLDSTVITRSGVRATPIGGRAPLWHDIDVIGREFASAAGSHAMFRGRRSRGSCSHLLPCYGAGCPKSRKIGLDIILVVFFSCSVWARNPSVDRLEATVTFLQNASRANRNRD